MTTTQKIQAVLATGELGLPDGVHYVAPDEKSQTQWHPYWVMYGKHGARQEITDQQAYDLIAAHWARETKDAWLGEHMLSYQLAAMKGDSEAAIAAIHAALCGGDGDDA